MKYFLLTLCLLAFAGCNQSPTPESPSRSATTVPAGTASIIGTIRFIGTAPTMKDFPNSTCAPAYKPVMEESILVDKSGGLQNCFVYLKGPAVGDGSSRAPVLLDQVNCRYAPHVLALMVNQPMLIRSSDATLHNVHVEAQINPTANYAMMHAGQETTTHFAYPEIFRVTCDVHPWMTAWVGVFANPWFAVSDSTGHFQIKNIPAGKYQIVVWQERLGQQQQTITLSNDQSLKQDFSYNPAAAEVSVK